MKRLTGRKPASNVAQYNRLSGNIFRSLDFMIALHPRIWEELADGAGCNWNAIGITDKRKTTNQVNTIQSPNAKTMVSVISIWAALMEECWSISLMFWASRSISALYLSSPWHFAELLRACGASCLLLSLEGRQQ
jgi:hypothetical protein